MIRISSGISITNGGRFEVEYVKERHGRRVLEDLLALKGMYETLFHCGKIDFVADPETINELGRKTRDDRNENRMILRDELLEWWSEKVKSEHAGEDFEGFTNESIRLLDSGKFDFLPDSQDRFLVAAAVASKCDVFLTMDYNTILKFSELIQEIVEPMKILRPKDYFGYVPNG